MKNILALLADLANGIYALLFAAWYFEVSILWWQIIVALALASLPDIDALPELLRRGKVAASAAHPNDHRTFLHYPIIALPTVIISLWLGGFWGMVLAIAIFLHLINDLYGTGWGLPLLWPINKSHYKICGRRVNRLRYILESELSWNALPLEEKKFRLLVSWSPEELPDYIVRWGLDDWIEKWYLNLNWISFIEYSLFIFACGLLFLLHPGLLYF